MALEIAQIVDLADAVDVLRKGPASEIRSTSVMDREIARHRRAEFVIVSARYRQPEKVTELALEPDSGEVIAQRGARRQTGRLSDALGKRSWQTWQAWFEIARRVHAAHQTHGLLLRRPGEAQRLTVERAGCHGPDEKQ